MKAYEQKNDFVQKTEQRSYGGSWELKARSLPGIATIH